eukprot:Skav202176  [mRNA]  locus=scaffold3078:33949:37509:- [translate_table: standard]
MAWKKEGLTQLNGGPFDAIDINLPIRFQDQEARVVNCTSGTISLETPVRLRSAAACDLVISQRSFVVEPDDVHQALFESWNAFFQRDCEDSLYHVSPDMMKFIENVPKGDTCPCPDITGHQLHQAMITTKPTSARGSDGWSTRDLAKLPEQLCSALAALLSLVEVAEKWPVRWVYAKTVCLPKTQEAQSAMQARPITIMSRAYRAWAKIRGQQIAQMITCHIPKQIGGASMHVSSDLIALLNAITLEDSLLHDKRTCGIVLDIIKAYNAIPRGGLLKLMAWLGVPAPMLQGYRAMMKQMLRFFQAVQSCSGCQTTTTGIIEGCSVAVPAMLAISIMAHYTIIKASPNTTTAIFADNWSFNGPDPPSLCAAFYALHEMTCAWKLGISPQKNWAWATVSSFRKQLRNLVIDGACIPVVFHEKDLGVEQSYCRKKHMKTIKDRMTKTKARLGVIKGAKIPRGCRKRVTVAAGLANMNYVNGFTSISKTDHHGLRSAAAKAMLRTGSGSNAYLACNAVDMDVDPEFRAFTQSLQLWRRFLRCFPDELQRFLLCCRSLDAIPHVHKRPGPVANFISFLKRFGLSPDFSALRFEVNGIQIDWALASMKTLKRILHGVWVDHFTAQRIDRKHFDINGFDAAANRHAFNKLDFQECSIVEQVFTGRHFTNDMLSKFLPCVQPSCPLCGEPDSREHRIFDCEQLNQYRTNFRQIKFLRTRWNRGHWFFGLCPRVRNYWSLIQAWTDTEREFSIPPRNNNCCHVFVDGSAHFGDHPDLTIAAAAWIQADHMQHQVKQRYRRPVPGLDQSSFAAELYAVLLTLNTCWRVVIYCDCQAVCDLLWFFLEHGHDNSWASRGLPYLWLPILEHLKVREPGDISIIKVKSHRSSDDAADEVDAWHIWGNNMVDHEAKAAFHDRENLFKKFSAAYKEASRHRHDICELYQYIATTGQQFIKQRNEQVKKEIAIEAFVPSNITALRFPTHGVRCCPELRREHYLAFPWNPGFLWRLQSWIGGLRWGQEDDSAADVSFLELYVDFCLTTSTVVPVNVFDKKQRDKYTCYKYVLPDKDVRVDYATRTLSVQHQLWSKILQWLHHQCPGIFFPAGIQQKCLSLQSIGCSRAHQGFNRRPILNQRWDAAQLLRDFFITPTGTVRSLDRVLNIPVRGQPEVLPHWCDTPFTACVAGIRRAKDVFKDLND